MACFQASIMNHNSMSVSLSSEMFCIWQFISLDQAFPQGAMIIQTGVLSKDLWIDECCKVSPCTTLWNRRAN